jgi:sorting nexin-29
LTRTNPYIKEIIEEYKAGFMLGKSTIYQIHIVKQAVEKSHEYNKDTYQLFVDFKAAYDSINRDKLWEVMDQLGILAELTRLIKPCTFNSKSKISFGGELSELYRNL